MQTTLVHNKSRSRRLSNSAHAMGWRHSLCSQQVVPKRRMCQHPENRSTSSWWPVGSVGQLHWVFAHLRRRNTKSYSRMRSSKVRFFNAFCLTPERTLVLVIDLNSVASIAPDIGFVTVPVILMNALPLPLISVKSNVAHLMARLST